MEPNPYTQIPPQEPVLPVIEAEPSQDPASPAEEAPARFQLSFSLTKKDFMEYAWIHAKKNHQGIRYFIVGLVAFIVNLILVAVLDDFPEYPLLFVSVLLWILSLNGDKSMGQSLMRAYRKEKGDQDTTTYRFEDTKMVGLSQYEQLQIQYPSITSIYANKYVYALYKSKGAAYVIPKNAFSPGILPAFEAFLYEKTGQEIHYTKPARSAIKRILIWLVMFVVLVAGIVTAEIIRDDTSYSTTTYRDNGFHIVLPDNFVLEDDTEEGYAFSAYTRKCMVYSYWDITDDMDFDAFAAQCAMDEMNSTDNLEQAADGSWHFEYTVETSSGDYDYCYIHIYQGSDAFWNTTFQCPEKDAEKMRPQFEEWAATVSTEY